MSCRAVALQQGLVGLQRGTHQTILVIGTQRQNRVPGDVGQCTHGNSILRKVW